ncbi:hypothetical protein WDW37_10645 [Bdellovibrionota bacterium FG-1]
MKNLNSTRLGTAVGAGLLATLSLLPKAWGELVYEGSAPLNENSNSVQIEDRSTMRQAIGASEKAAATIQAQAPSVVEETVAPAPVAEAQNFSKSELMRRQRQREEIKNEDLLQERLEDLRLRDERKRLDQVFAAPSQSPSPVPAQMAAQMPVQMPVQMKEEMVMAPVTSGGPSPLAMVDTISLSRAAPVAAPSGMSVTTAEPSVTDKTWISVAPHGGLSNLIGQGGYFDIRPHFAVGIGAEVSASDNFSFVVGYTFNEYGVAMTSSNPFVLARQATAMMQGTPASIESVAMKQNVFDAGLKVHLLGPDSKLRPFIGAGGSYAKSYINFDSKILADMNSYYGRSISPDYEVSNFLGYLSGGLDVKISKSISVGAEFKYYAVLSSRENNNFSNYYGAMYPSAYGGAYNGYNAYSGVNPYTGTDTSVAGGSLARASFYSILGVATFTF